SFHILASPDKHQCIQSSCFFPPVEAECASALNSLMGVSVQNMKTNVIESLEKVLIYKSNLDIGS
ncbi:hypothetical protein Csa_004334, partial [Cucumis sativus]